MRRNLRRRVEVAFPLYDPEVREEVLALLEMQLDDNSKARVIDADQKNAYVEPRGGRRAQVDAYDYLALRAGVAAAQRHVHPAARPDPAGDGWALRPVGAEVQDN